MLEAIYDNYKKIDHLADFSRYIESQCLNHPVESIDALLVLMLDFAENTHDEAANEKLSIIKVLIEHINLTSFTRRQINKMLECCFDYSPHSKCQDFIELLESLIKKQPTLIVTPFFHAFQHREENADNKSQTIMFLGLIECAVYLKDPDLLAMLLKYYPVETNIQLDAPLFFACSADVFHTNAYQVFALELKQKQKGRPFILIDMFSPKICFQQKNDKIYEEVLTCCSSLPSSNRYFSPQKLKKRTASSQIIKSDLLSELYEVLSTDINNGWAVDFCYKTDWEYMRQKVNDFFTVKYPLFFESCSAEKWLKVNNENSSNNDHAEKCLNLLKTFNTNLTAFEYFIQNKMSLKKTSLNCLSLNEYSLNQLIIELNDFNTKLFAILRPINVLQLPVLLKEKLQIEIKAICDAVLGNNGNLINMSKIQKELDNKTIAIIIHLLDHLVIDYHPIKLDLYKLGLSIFLDTKKELFTSLPINFHLRNAKLKCFCLLLENLTDYAIVHNSILNSDKIVYLKSKADPVAALQEQGCAGELKTYIFTKNEICLIDKVLNEIADWISIFTPQNQLDMINVILTLLPAFIKNADSVTGISYDRLNEKNHFYKLLYNLNLTENFDTIIHCLDQYLDKNSKSRKYSLNNIEIKPEYCKMADCQFKFTIKADMIKLNHKIHNSTVGIIKLAPTDFNQLMERLEQVLLDLSYVKWFGKYYAEKRNFKSVVDENMPNFLNNLIILLDIILSKLVLFARNKIFNQALLNIISNLKTDCEVFFKIPFINVHLSLQNRQDIKRIKSSIEYLDRWMTKIAVSSSPSPGSMIDAFFNHGKRALDHLTGKVKSAIDERNRSKETQVSDDPNPLIGNDLL